MSTISKDGLVSIVIPTYNHAGYLSSAIESVLGQTYTNYEIIIINNYSEDNTIAVVDGFSDPRINLINFKNNGVIAASRNKGIELAKGDYVAFLDSDDYWYPNKLEKCMGEFQNGIGVVCHGELWIRNDKPYKEVMYGPADKAQYMSLLLDGNCISTSATIVRKSVLYEVGLFSNNPDFITVEDYDLWLKIAGHGVVFKFVDTILGVYRFHEGNASSGIFLNLSATLKVLNRHISSIASFSSGLKLKIYKRKAQLYLGVARRIVTRGFGV